jgi:FkbM family methyltransferase
MSGLHINYSPRMTAALVKAGAFREQPFTVVDVGARGGVASYWAVFGDHLRIIGFDLDPEECKRLNAIDPRTQYLPYALDRQSGRRIVYVANYSSSSSFYRTDPDYFARYTASENATVLSEPMLETNTLSAALASIGLASADFIKVDAEGAELEILQGGEDLLPGVQGILSEVRFSRKMCGCPIYWELEKYLREQSFELYDLDVYRLAKKALPYPYLYSNYFDDGRPAAGPSTQGQVLWADALYMRDLMDTSPDARRLIVAACLFEIFGLADCAAELILAHRRTFDTLVPSAQLLDLLVPEVKGQSLTYQQYTDRDLVGDPLLRPADGRRFPESVIPQYDGEFAASWEGKRVVKDSFWQRLLALFG